MFNSIVENSLVEAIEFLGEPIVIGTATMKAVVNTIQMEEELLDGGVLRKRGITAVIKKIPQVPTIGTTLLFQGKSYRIISINIDSAGIEIVCESDAR